MIFWQICLLWQWPLSPILGLCFSNLVSTWDLGSSVCFILESCCLPCSLRFRLFFLLSALDHSASNLFHFASFHYFFSNTTWTSSCGCMCNKGESLNFKLEFCKINLLVHQGCSLLCLNYGFMWGTNNIQMEINVSCVFLVIIVQGERNHLVKCG